ncbi:GAF domain-containing protein [Myxococcota bacterium]|nr:GAF domain-containing protein [Myxococcota bacterium]MBU1899803.1 GAF domain-containing protein [Myxococcota bacterium]
MPSKNTTLNLWLIGEAPPWLASVAPVLHAQPEDLPGQGEVVILAPANPSARGALLSALGDDPTALLILVSGPLPSDEEEALYARGIAAILPQDQPGKAAAQLRALLRSRPRPRAGEQRRREALEVAAHLLRTLTDEKDTFHHLVEILARELRSQRVSLLEVDWESQTLQMRAAIGLSEEVIRTARPKVGEGIAGTCALLGKPLFIDDHAQLKARATDLSAFIPDTSRFGPLPMSLTVPILVRGEVVGVVNATDRHDGEPFSREDIHFISALMGHAGYLIENATLFKHLRALKAFSERVINTLSDPLVVVDPELQIISLNHRFEALFGGRVGVSLWSCVEANEGQRAAISAARQDPGSIEPASLDDWQLAERLFDIHVAPFSDGEAQRYLITFRDMTSRRQLERRVVSAEKMASLGVLAAGVAHEINNPLGFIKSNLKHARGYLDDLLRLHAAWAASGAMLPKATREALTALGDEIGLEDIQADAAQLFEETQRGVNRVEAIVAGLKSFAHPDTQKAREADLKALIDNAMLLTQGKWKYKLVIEARHTSHVIYCLPTQLEQVFMNLIVNAAQASPEWETLTITSAETAQGVRLIFEDTCGGIPEAHLERIFEPFFTTKDIGVGSGLGLSISYNIIEAHGGRLFVESESGVGTRFIIDLPKGQVGRPLVIKQESRFRM